MSGAFPLYGDTIREISKNTSLNDIFRICRVNKMFYTTICQHDEFWRELARTYLTDDTEITLPLTELKRDLYDYNRWINDTIGYHERMAFAKRAGERHYTKFNPRPYNGDFLEGAALGGHSDLYPTTITEAEIEGYEVPGDMRRTIQDENKYRIKLGTVERMLSDPSQREKFSAKPPREIVNLTTLAVNHGNSNVIEELSTMLSLEDRLGLIQWLLTSHWLGAENNMKYIRLMLGDLNEDELTRLFNMALNRRWERSMDKVTAAISLLIPSDTVDKRFIEAVRKQNKGEIALLEKLISTKLRLELPPRNQWEKWANERQ